MRDDEKLSEEPLSALRLSFIQLHEYYLEAVHAEFTKCQAMELVKTIIVSGMKNNE